LSHLGIHICFNLLEGRPCIRKKVLETGSYSRFEFDEALQYVAVRRLVFGKQDSEAEPAMSTEGRKDMVTLFTWLHGKGVQNIIKVIVNDHDHPSHSDEAIEQALKPFDVEILDWSKPDLCPETIQQACRGVRELHLRWSGLNGMLRAWSEKDGLARLPRLTDIYLRQTKVNSSDL